MFDVLCFRWTHQCLEILQAQFLSTIPWETTSEKTFPPDIQYLLKNSNYSQLHTVISKSETHFIGLSDILKGKLNQKGLGQKNLINDKNPAPAVSSYPAKLSIIRKINQV